MGACDKKVSGASTSCENTIRPTPFELTSQVRSSFAGVACPPQWLPLLLVRCHIMRALPLPYTVTPYSTALVRLDVQILIYYKGLRCGRRVALLYTLK